MSLDSFPCTTARCRRVVVATGGTEPVLDSAAVQRLAIAATRPMLIIDFGLPPNIDPAAAKVRRPRAHRHG